MLIVEAIAIHNSLTTLSSGARRGRLASGVWTSAGARAKQGRSRTDNCASVRSDVARWHHKSLIASGRGGRASDKAASTSCFASNRCLYRDGGRRRARRAAGGGRRATGSGRRATGGRWTAGGRLWTRLGRWGGCWCRCRPLGLRCQPRGEGAEGRPGPLPGGRPQEAGGAPSSGGLWEPAADRTDRTGPPAGLPLGPPPPETITGCGEGPPGGGRGGRDRRQPASGRRPR